MQDLKICLIQANLLWEDIPGNLQKLEGLVNSKERTSDLIMLPEMFSTGFSMRPGDFAERNSREAIPFMHDLAKKQQAAVCGSLIIQEEGAFFNRLFFVTPNGEQAIYDKRHLFTFVGEENYYSAGKKRLIIDYRGWRICPMVCYDLRFPAWSRNRLKEGPLEYDLLLYVANWPERRRLAWRSLLRARAIENLAFVAGVNRIGKDGNDIDHSGDSSLFNPIGECLGEYTNQEGRFDFHLSSESLLKLRERFGFWRDGDAFEISAASTQVVRLS